MLTETRVQITMGLNKVIINGKDPIDPLSSIYIYCTRNTSANTDIYVYTTMDHMRHAGHTINPTHRMSGESGCGAALEQLPDMASHSSANGCAAVQVGVLILDDVVDTAWCGHFTAQLI